MSERDQLERAIAALEAQRASLGHGVVDTALGPLKTRLRQLGSEPPASRRRKLVTILFADIHGFTAMAETMDPEQLDELMSEVWARLDHAITEHGGRIDKHIGDAVMALWGVEATREDDAERAISAALAMARALQGLPTNVTLRIGINTGAVLLGRVGSTQEYTATGDAVNIASRLERAAPVGGILISHETYQQVRGVFAVSAQPPIDVAGKSEPLQTYVVHRAKSRAFRTHRRGLEGVETRLVGRGGELCAMQAAVDSMLETSSLRVVTLRGEAGMGKSRLIEELEAWVELREESFRYFRGRASLQTRRTPFALIRDLFVFRFLIQDSDAPTLVRDKLVRGLSEALGDEGERAAHAIASLVGFDLGPSTEEAGLGRESQLRDSALTSLTDYFVALSRTAPPVLILEDIHWADEGSLAVVEHLMRTTRSAAVMLLCAARPALWERRQRWGEGSLDHTVISLGPLSRHHATELVDELLHRLDDVPVALRELVVARAEGNPYYLEELVKKLIDDGVIVTGGERWQVVPDRLAEAKVPATLSGIVEARLDVLPHEERSVLGRASVFGRIFWDAGVMALSASGASDGAGELPRALDALCRKGMIFKRDGSAFAGTQEYAFLHAIMREVTYETVLLSERRQAHAAVARWLIAHSGERAAEYAGVVADHWELAGRPDEAMGHLMRVADRAVQTGASREGYELVRRALACLEQLDDSPERRRQRYLLLVCEGVARSQLSDFDGADRRLREGLAQARRADDSACVVEALSQLAQLEAARGRYEPAKALLVESLELARRAGDDTGMSHTLVTLGWIDFRLGDFGAAKARFSEGRDLCARVGDKHGLALALTRLGSALFKLAEDAQARVCFEQAIALCRETGDRRELARALNNLGDQLWRQGDLAPARSCFDEALAICEALGEQLGAGVAHSNYGHVAGEQGDFEVAALHYRRAIHIFMAIGAHPPALDALAGYAAPLAAGGDQTTALSVLGMVLSASTSGEEELFTAQRILAKIRGTLTDEQLEAGLAAGRGRNIEELVVELFPPPP